jgi:hypothetical protein
VPTESSPISKETNAMPDAGRAVKAAAADRSSRGDKKAARKRQALEAELTKADKLVAKRTAQLESAKADRAKAAARLASSAAPAKAAPAKAAAKPTAAKAKPAPAKAPAATAKAAGAKGKAATAPMAYCLRDKTRVAMVGAKAVVLAGGRKGVSGTCPKCGAKLVRLGTL